MEENKRGTWGSSFGFIMAAVGSAVGLGNIWGFPYKMGANGGFAFLLVYIVAILLAGLAVMLGELSLGRKFGYGAVGAYTALNKKYKIIGYLTIFSAFIILPFYSVLSGYITRYMVGFLAEIFSPGAGFGGADGPTFFSTYINNAGGSILFLAIFLAATALIVAGGVQKGIEKFSKIAMPALVVMLVIVIIRGCTLPGAVDGLKFMFAPKFSAFKEIGFLNIFKTAACQVFFSLSLGSGIMFTYGSYLSKKESMEKNIVLISICDTIVALLAGMATLPAVAAYGLDYSAGAGLLFMSLYEVFTKGMGGTIGAIFGFLFYALCFMAVVTSSVSLLEVPASFVIDKRVAANKPFNRKKICLVTVVIEFILGIPVCLDGLGGGNIIGSTFFFGKWGFLDFYDFLSEGFFMPLVSLILCILIGWVYKTKFIQDEVELEGNKLKWAKFWDICFKVVTPLVMLLVLYGQFQSFGLAK